MHLKMSFLLENFADELYSGPNFFFIHLKMSFLENFADELYGGQKKALSIFPCSLL